MKSLDAKMALFMIMLFLHIRLFIYVINIVHYQLVNSGVALGLQSV